MRILGMEASIRQFVRLRNPADILNDIARAQPILVNMRRVAYQTENRFRCALAVMDIDAIKDSTRAFCAPGFKMTIMVFFSFSALYAFDSLSLDYTYKRSGPFVSVKGPRCNRWNRFYELQCKQPVFSR